MAYNRKYETYKITITYKNGDTEEIDYNGINTGDYDAMLERYRKIKNEYSNESVTIEFIGTNSDGTIKIFWTKKIEVDSDTEATDTIPTDVLLDHLESVLKTLKTRRHKTNTKYGVLSKSQDVLLHRIETIKFSNIKSEAELNLEKIKIFNELESVRDERRETKNETYLANNINDKIKIDKLLESITVIKSQYQANLIKLEQNKEKGYLSEDKIAELNIMRKVPYRTEKERISLVKQLSPKYDKVYYENGEVICYSLGYTDKNKDKIAK